jgi:glycosyltransferase involved in cell wall biosynthesis
MRILHAPVNIAGIAGLVAKAQRQLGYDATSVEYSSKTFNFATDRSLHLEQGHNRLLKAGRVFNFAASALMKYDVFHLYFGNTLIPRLHFDLQLLHTLGKRVIFHFCGCDIRRRDINLGKYDLSGCHECSTLACLNMYHPPLRFANHVLVATPDLLEFVPGAELMPGPVDLSEWQPEPFREKAADEPIKVLHAPTDRGIKGSNYIIAAVERLKQRYNVELLLLENVPHAQVKAFASQADIVVDQIMIGAYGTVAIEQMAKGKPVVCYIRPDLRQYYRATLPIVSATPTSIYDELEKLVTDASLRRSLGAQGVEYVRQVHDVNIVAARMIEIYKQPATPRTA